MIHAIPSDASWNADAHPVVRISRDEAAGLVRNGRRVLVF